MTTELAAIAAGVLGGGLFLIGLYLLARKKAMRSGKRPIILFLRCLALLALVHGLGLMIVTVCVLFGAPALFGPLPAMERQWMGFFILVGFVCVAVGAVTLRTAAKTT